jgi:hypothetical protein
MQRRCMGRSECLGACMGDLDACAWACVCVLCVCVCVALRVRVRVRVRVFLPVRLDDVPPCPPPQVDGGTRLEC